MAEAPGFDIRRILLIAGVVVVVVFGALLLLFRGCASVPRTSGYTVIYSNLELRDAANVIARLKELAIPYEIREDGRAIAVPKEKSDQARLGLAEKNLPMGGAVGWEIFDQNRMGATDFDRRIQLIRAISGELSRTIRRIEGVEDVRVQIVIPETKLFAATVSPVTASVLLKLQPGVELSKEKISGIVHLVSSSVENLQPENVTVVDETGNILSFNIRTTGEVYALAPVPPPAEKPVTIMTAEAAPAGLTLLPSKEVPAVKVIASGEVAANLTRLPLSTEALTRVASLTAEERIILKAQAKRDMEKDLSGKAQELLNRFYPPNSIIIKVGIEILPAKEGEIRSKDLKIKRLEAIILVDNRIELNAKLKRATFTTVAAAIGYDKKRGDHIILQAVPFHLATPPLVIPPIQGMKGEIPKVSPVISVRGWLSWMGIFFLLLIIGWLITRIMVQRRETAPSAPEEEAMVRLAHPAPAAERMPVLEKIKSQAENDPEKIAELLKNWLSEQ